MKYFSLLMVLLLSSGLVQAKNSINPTVNKARIEYSKGNYKRAKKILLTAARMGNTPAQISLGIMYMEAQGIPRDYEKAKYWFNEASKKTSKGYYYLALIAHKGYGEKVDMDKAIGLYETAYSKGNKQAGKMLARLYFQKGQTAKAKELFVAGSKSGDAESMYNLAVLYEKSNNTKQAKELYEKAARKGYTNAQYNLATLYYKAGDYKNAFFWFKGAADRGDVESSYNTGLLYYKGKGTKINKIKAYHYWIQAAQKSHLKAQEYLDELCRESPWACDR